MLALAPHIPIPKLALPPVVTRVSKRSAVVCSAVLRASTCSSMLARMRPSSTTMRFIPISTIVESNC